MGTLSEADDPREERVFAAMKRLQLTHLRDVFTSILSQAAKEEWTYLEFLDQILRREVDAKQGKRIQMGCRSRTSLVSGPSKGLISRSSPRRMRG